MFTVGGHCLHLAGAANSAGHLANSDKNKLILNPMPHVHSWGVTAYMWRVPQTVQDILQIQIKTS
jgi:hypothetical protein